MLDETDINLIQEAADEVEVFIDFARLLAKRQFGVGASEDPSIVTSLAMTIALRDGVKRTTTQTADGMVSPNKTFGRK